MKKPPPATVDAAAAFATLRAAFAAQRPIEVIGIVDSHGAIHGVPKFGGSAPEAMLIHEDVFTTCQKRWRYRPASGGFVTLPDKIGIAGYQLDEEETAHVMRFLQRRGWD